MKRFAVSILIFAFSVIMITELSSAPIVHAHSKQVQINEEDIQELGTRTLISWFHRQIDFGTFQPIIDTILPASHNTFF